MYNIDWWRNTSECSFQYFEINHSSRW